ncbi:Negative regulator of sigma24 activity (fragment) [Cupriavidus necator]|uniref:Negative regulator of sigma24 activity n=1 Tax=Cupriavidus necator TaxID=106590 RepID=A0A1K0J744_CUPNE
MVARADQPAASPASGIVTVAAENPQMIRDPRLDEYLRAHRTSVATDAFVPTMRTVANGANFTQENTQE